MRDIKTLLQLMLDNQQYFISGLCNWNGELWFARIVSTEESNILGKYIDNNRPKWWTNWEIFINRNNSYWWKRADINPRIKWLKKHIKKNS